MCIVLMKKNNVLSGAEKHFNTQAVLITGDYGAFTIVCYRQLHNV